MTIRERLNQKKRRLVCAFFASIGTFAAGSLLLPARTLLGRFGIALVVPGFALGCLTIVYAFFSFRCPLCEGPWYGLAMNTGPSLFSIDRRIRYCPFCGADIDTGPDGRSSRNQ